MYNISDEIKVTIDINNLNLDKLVEAIWVFEAIHKYKPYVICSYNTKKQLILSQKYSYWCNSCVSNFNLDEINGCKILIDTSLPFGEIKIR